MRKAMTERGTWRHRVPVQEEGEPPTKKSRTLEPDSAGGEDDPEEGTSKQAQEDLGKHFVYIFQNGWDFRWIKWMQSLGMGGFRDYRRVRDSE